MNTKSVLIYTFILHSFWQYQTLPQWMNEWCIDQIPNWHNIDTKLFCCSWIRATKPQHSGIVFAWNPLTWRTQTHLTKSHPFSSPCKLEWFITEILCSVYFNLWNLCNWKTYSKPWFIRNIKFRIIDWKIWGSHPRCVYYEMTTRNLKVE